MECQKNPISLKQDMVIPCRDTVFFLQHEYVRYQFTLPIRGAGVAATVVVVAAVVAASVPAAACIALLTET